MLDLKLAVPIYLDRQLKKISRRIGLSKEQIRQLSHHTLPTLAIFTEDIHGYKKYDLLELQEEKEKNSFVNKTNLPSSGFLSGTDAIIWLCQEKDIDVQPLREIHIPLTVYEECDKDQWQDICSSFADVARRNSRIERLIELGAPEIIISNESMVLWEYVEYLETGVVFGKSRRWNHGRIIRGLNDIGFSLIYGWSDYMKEDFETRSESETSEEREARKHRQRINNIHWCANYYAKKGLSPIDALMRASDEINGNPKTRITTIEGIGILLPSRMSPHILYTFLENHRNVFGKNKTENIILENLKHAEETDDAFEDTNYELDGTGYGFEHWSVAVANVMIRETGINFDTSIADKNDKYASRSFILFPEKSPWLYNEKEKKLSENMLYQILDRYALELHLSVCTNCYYVMEVEDLD